MKPSELIHKTSPAALSEVRREITGKEYRQEHSTRDKKRLLKQIEEIEKIIARLGYKIEIREITKNKKMAHYRVLTVNTDISIPSDWEMRSLFDISTNNGRNPDWWVYGGRYIDSPITENDWVFELTEDREELEFRVFDFFTEEWSDHKEVCRKWVRVEDFDPGKVKIWDFHE